MGGLKNDDGVVRDGRREENTSQTGRAYKGKTHEVWNSRCVDAYLLVLLLSNDDEITQKSGFEEAGTGEAEIFKGSGIPFPSS